MKKNLLFLAVLFFTTQIWAQQVTFTESSGWLESVFVKWQPISNAQTYNVYYTGEGVTDKKIDNELIRSYGSYYRADIPGLKAGSYTITVKPVISGIETPGSTTNSLTVKAQDRTGFAFSNGRVPGAYNLDGTPKSNAVILYITEQTKNTISQTVTGATTNPCVGLQAILDGYKKGKDLRPYIIRIVGQITDPTYLLDGDLVIENNKTANCYLTLEGIGDDAVADGWGIRVKNASNIEIRNIATMNCNSGEGDNIGLQQNNDYIWVHNCDFFYGDAGGDADQAKGDGALDCKKSTYITFSYNHFWDSGKSNLLGLSEGTTAGLYITYHHNWYDHSDSRHPRVRYYSAHVYNNYYDGNSKYGVGSTLGSSVFVENNFFRNCKYPMLTSMQGTDVYGGAEGTFSNEAGGTIKAYNNTMSGQTRFVGYDATNFPKEFDAYVATTRNETINSSITSKSGSNTYNNFDTNSSIMYSYTPDSPDDAKTNVMQYAGRVSGGDLKWTFNNTVDDTADAVNTGLKAALIGYQTSLVAIQGGTNEPTGNQTLSSPANKDQTVTSGTAISSIVFTWGGDATDATITGLPASGLTFVKNTTNKTITISGTPTASISYSIATSGTLGTSATSSGTITIAAVSGNQTLISPANKDQTVTSGTAISSIVFTWGGDATDTTVTGLPSSGLTFVKNTTNKTITISGTPTANVSYSIATSGTLGTSATSSGTITVTANTPSSDEIHNFTTSGKTSSFYTITGNMNSTAGTQSYDGLTLTARLKIESSTSIEYTTTAASTLTLVFDSGFSGAIKVNNTSFTAVNGIATISLPAGTNKITKDNVANLYYIKTAYSSENTLRLAQNIETQSPKIMFYPNPVTATLYVADPNQQIEKLIIYNVSGTIIKNIESNFENIDMSTLNSGSYIAKIITKDGSSTSQIIVKK